MKLRNFVEMLAKMKIKKIFILIDKKTDGKNSIFDERNPNMFRECTPKTYFSEILPTKERLV